MKFTHVFRSLVAGGAILLGAIAAALAQVPVRKPSIVVIWGDDIGLWC